MYCRKMLYEPTNDILERSSEIVPHFTNVIANSSNYGFQIRKQLPTR